MKLYTKTGDFGTTSVVGKRLSKDDLRVETYGTFDELNSFIGFARTELDLNIFEELDKELEKIQHELFDCGADIANVNKTSNWCITEEEIQYLEQRIDYYADVTPPLERFILPGGTKEAASLHVARTVTRRAERLLVKLQNEEKNVPTVIGIYFNRLSDYFFVVARFINMKLNVDDIEYKRSPKVFR